MKGSEKMQLERRHIDALGLAESLIFHSDFCPYLELKEMLPDASALGRRRFRLLFTRFYNLDNAHLTDEFKARFFEILFAGDVAANGKPAFSRILNELYEIRRKQGDRAMQFSFVSKLVGIHHECSPIYDQHVLRFFRGKPPTAREGNSFRINWFTNFLDDVADSYVAWAADERMRPVVEKLKARDARLRELDDVRLLDFLVWKAGNQKLLLHCDRT